MRKGITLQERERRNMERKKKRTGVTLIDLYEKKVFSKSFSPYLNGFFLQIQVR